MKRRIFDNLICGQDQSDFRVRDSNDPVSKLIALRLSVKALEIGVPVQTLKAFVKKDILSDAEIRMAIRDGSIFKLRNVGKVGIRKAAALLGISTEKKRCELCGHWSFGKLQDKDIPE